MKPRIPPHGREPRTTYCLWGASGILMPMIEYDTQEEAFAEVKRLLKLYPKSTYAVESLLRRVIWETGDQPQPATGRVTTVP